MTKNNTVELKKIITQLNELSDEHKKIILKNIKIEHFLKEIQTGQGERLEHFAHELKKPLTVIRSLISGCSLDSVSEKMRKTLEEIDNEVSRAAELIDSTMLVS